MALLEDVAADADFEGQSRGVGIELRVTSGHDVPERGMSDDAELVRRAIENIVRNALRFSPQLGTVEIVVTPLLDRLIIEVADTGPGVAASRLDELFQPFVKDGSGGWGLGLAIAKRAIEAHGGDIRAGNRSGGGLSVIIDLPVDRTGRSPEQGSV